MHTHKKHVAIALKGGMPKQPVLDLSVLPIFFYFWTNPGHIPVELIFLNLF